MFKYSKFEPIKGCVGKISFNDYAQLCCDSEWFECTGGLIKEISQLGSGKQRAFTGLEQEEGGYPPSGIQNFNGLTK